jgi:hypothetical protein
MCETPHVQIPPGGVPLKSPQAVGHGGHGKAVQEMRVVGVPAEGPFREHDQSTRAALGQDLEHGPQVALDHEVDRKLRDHRR